MNANLPRQLKPAFSGLMIALLVAAASAEVVLDPPRQVRLVSTDGQAIRAVASRMDRDGIHGADGLVPWGGIRLREASRLWLSLMDRTSGEDWLDGAWILLVHPGSTPRDRQEAERFLGEATGLLVDGPGRVTALRAEAAEHVARREQQEARTQRRQSRQLGTEAGDWSTTPWPATDPAAEERRKDRLRDLLRKQLGKPDDDATTPTRFITTRHFYLASDEPRTDLHDIGLELDHLVSEMNATFGRSLDDRPFAPRAAALVFSDAARRSQVEQDVFEFPARAGAAAWLHVVGPDDGDLVLTIDASDLARARPHMRHEVVHAWMHRHRSPARPPAWFNEGLAHAVAWWRVPPGEQTWRRSAVDHIRRDGYIDTLLATPYGPGAWTMTGEDTAVAGLLVRRLLEERREQVVDWVERIKRGEPSDTAFRAAFGAEIRDELGRHLRYWELND